jgi:hypothetical protein
VKEIAHCHAVGIDPTCPAVSFFAYPARSVAAQPAAYTIAAKAAANPLCLKAVKSVRNAVCM